MLENLQPQNVFYYFEQICQIPHGSGNIRQISDFLVQFAKERDLKYTQDSLGNVIIIKKATKGYEKKEPIIVQGHMDMVAVKEKKCAKDMTKEGLDLVVEGDYISAKGTSLGGDDGIAVAYALALLDSDTIPHPKLEVVITVDEETGMEGASEIDLSKLKGKTLLNIDSEKEGELTVACAGGVRINAEWNVDWTDTQDEQYEIILSGLKGGHSGTEIDKKRANANKLLMHIIYMLEREVDISLTSYQGGKQDNVITTSATATFSCKAGEEEIKSVVQVLETSLRETWGKTDPHLSLKVEKTEKKYQKGLETSDFYRLLSFFLDAPNGVQAMSESLEGIVETSLNMGMVSLVNKGKMTAGFLLRSSSVKGLDELSRKLSRMIQESQGDYRKSGAYPAWEYRKDSPLREKMIQIYQKLYHEKPTVLSIHAGLECGILAQKIEDLDSVSFGPDILDIHTTKERLSISSTKRTWEYLLAILES